MAKVALPLRIHPWLLERVDAARGDVPRTRWVERAIEAALGDDGKPRVERVATVARAVRATSPVADGPPKSGGAYDAGSSPGEGRDSPGLQNADGLPGPETDRPFVCLLRLDQPPAEPCVWSGATVEGATCPHHGRKALPRAEVLRRMAAR